MLCIIANLYKTTTIKTYTCVFSVNIIVVGCWAVFLHILCFALIENGELFGFFTTSAHIVSHKIVHCGFFNFVVTVYNVDFADVVFFHQTLQSLLRICFVFCLYRSGYSKQVFVRCIVDICINVIYGKYNFVPYLHCCYLVLQCVCKHTCQTTSRNDTYKQPALECLGNLLFTLFALFAFTA